MLITIIVPTYNEQEALPYFYDSVKAVMKEMQEENRVTFELLFVNDGSHDNTLNVIKSLARQDERVRYISFSRNFGKEAAIYAGLEHSKGELVSLMDADLQDPPVLLKEMYSAIVNEHVDCAAARRVSRKGEPKIRSFWARRFYRLINKISKTEIVDGARDFRLMTRQVVKAVLDVKEYNRFSKGIFGWVGFDTKWIEYENVERVCGETKWSFWKLFLYSIEGIVGFSTLPLSVASLFGILFCLISFLIILWMIIKTLIWGNAVEGYPSMICIMFFIGGIQLFSIGILGNYLAKSYLEVKKRPIYIIKEDSDNE